MEYLIYIPFLIIAYYHYTVLKDEKFDRDKRKPFIITLAIAVVFSFGAYLILLLVVGLIAKRKLLFPSTKGISADSFAFNGSVNLRIDNIFRGVLVVGGAGSGKSKTFIYPFIKQGADKGFTSIIYDFKSPELINFAKTCYLNTDIKTSVLDFKDVANSDRCNPVKYVESAIHANNYTQALIFNLLPEFIQKQDFWSRSIVSLFSGALWYFKKNHPSKATLPHIFAFFFTASPKQIADLLGSDREVKGIVSAFIEAVELEADRQIAGILGTLKTAIGSYNNEEIFWLFSADEINLNVNDPNNKTSLLIGNNSQLSDTYAPLISLVITISSKLMNEPNKAKSMIVVDEAPTLYLPNFEQIPATARSNKVAVIVGTQDVSQMIDKYGQTKTDVLISNLGNQFYGRTTNKKTAETLVKMFGQREDKQRLKSGSSFSTSIQKRDRLKIQEVTSLNQGEFVGFIAEGKPKDFKSKIKLQKLPTAETQTSNNKDYSATAYTNNFNKIYGDIESLFKVCVVKKYV